MGSRRSRWAVIGDLPLRYKTIVPVILVEIVVFIAAMQVTTTTVKKVAHQNTQSVVHSHLRLLEAAYLQMTLTADHESFQALVNGVSNTPGVVSVNVRPMESAPPSESFVEMEDGTNLYTAWRRIEIPGESTGIGISVTDHTVALTVKEARNRYGLILGIGIVLTTVVLWFIVSAITVPITRVAEAADRLAAGEHPRRFDITRRDEVGKLAYAFDAMAHELSRTHQRLQDLLSERTRHLDALFYNLTVGILYVDANHVIRAANPAMAEILGKSQDELIGSKCYEHAGLENGICPECVIENPDREIAHRTCTLNKGTREERILDKTIIRIPGVNGNEPQVMEIVYDVTKEKRIEAQLLQSSKLASIGQLASGLAHEINNPLGTILLRSYSLLKRFDDLNVPDELRDDVKAIERQANRVSRITRELLTFARISSTEQVPTDLGEVIDSSLILVNLRASKHGVTVKREGEHELPSVMGNRTQLEQVFVNILNNAIDASSPQSAVAIGAEEIHTDGGEYLVEIWVRDHGIGIPEEDLERIFDPFYTTKDAGEGTGLGLSISYGIVSAHNGTIEASGHPDGGTVFRVRLPALSGREAEDAV